MTHTSQHDETHVGAPYAGRSGGSALRLNTARRTSEQQPSSRARSGSRRPPEPAYQQGHSFGIHPADDNYSSDSFDRTVEHEGADYQEEPVRQRTSALRYPTPTSAARRDTVQLPPPKLTRDFTRRRRSRFQRGHLLLWSGLAMLVMLLGFVALNWLGSWWTTTTNDWTYGRPRTFQIDMVVGHHDSPQTPSHFLAVNLRRHVVVIEFPGGDASKAVTYLGPVLLGDGQDLLPVTLSFEDRNGDGKPDLNIHLGDQVIVFLNDGTKFVSPQH